VEGGATTLATLCTTPFTAAISTAVMGILFTHAPLARLLGKVVNLSKALAAGLGFKIEGY
jgi:hypothetical protein